MSLAALLFDRDLIMAAVSLVVSLVILWLYMRAVRRSAVRPALRQPEPIAPPREATALAPPAVALAIRDSSVPPARAGRAVWRGPARAALVQLVAGLVYGAAVALAWMWLASKAGGLPWLQWPVVAMFTLFFAWPLVVAIGLIATLSWRAWLLLLLAYVALLVPAAVYMMQGTPITPTQFAHTWWNINGPATVFVTVLLARPIRAFGPVVATLVVAADAGVFGLAGWLDAARIEQVSAIATALGFSGSAGGMAAGLLLFGGAGFIAALAGYLALRGLGRLYRSHWVSDQSIQTDAVWLTFAVLQAPRDLPYIGLAAFALYKVVAVLGQLALLRTGDDARAPRLLLLRVFSLGARSGHLFDGFARLWRYLGSVRMIAGPDLANATVELHEFLDFLAGRLQRRFITGPQVLEQRLAETAHQRRDWDGRFRVAGFFCHTDTWQATMRRLARDSDVVMMDLRGFARGSEGCIFELNELLDAVPLPGILLIVDRTTDEPFLAEVLNAAWTRIGAHSPNRDDPAPQVQLYRLEQPGERSIGRLVARMAELGAGRIAATATAGGRV